MRVLLIVAAFALVLAGCNMSGPGVARMGAMQPLGDPTPTTYNSDWVTRGDPDPVDSIEHKGELSIDISERKLGVRYFDEDTMIGDAPKPRHIRRQEERQEARRKAWRERMGIKTIKDEQAERD